MKSIKPVFPYYGGKRRIAPLLAKIIKSQLKEGSTYYEPFVGAGATFLELEYPQSVIGDIVPDLINMYECLRDDWQKVLWYYKKLPNTYDYYYKIRNFDRNPHFKTRNRYFRAARYIYLCITSFGSCRWNQLGQANQSYFRHPERPCVLNESHLLRTSKLLKTTKINYASFDETLKTVKEGDVVYLDPPYIDTKYDQYWITKFKRSDMKTLKTHCDELDKKGAKFILSHSASEFIYELYQDYHIVSLETYRYMKWQPEFNNKNDIEVLITNIDEILDLLDESLMQQVSIIKDKKR